MEMIIAMAMMGIIFAAIVPLFGQIRNSWDSKQAAAETLQNGRILIDHLNSNLSRAIRITAVSDSSQANGYIEFEDNDANDLRYDVNSTTGYVEFGSVGELYDLAGPASQLQFTCYDACDLDTPITDVNFIRFVKVEATLTNPTAPGQDKTLIASAYLRTNFSESSHSVGHWKLDETSGTTAADSSGHGNDGTLTNMDPATDWVTGQVGGALDFDGDNDVVVIGNPPSLQISGTEISVCAWFNADTLVFANWPALVGKTSTTSWTDGWGVFFNNDTINFYINNYSTNVAYKAFTTTGSWHHVAGTYDGTKIKIYVDGVKGIDYDYSEAINDGGNLTIAELGGYKFGRWDGKIDDVRVYNHALTAEQIVRLLGVQYREFTEAKAGSDTTSITISTPSGTNKGDLLIAAVATDDDTSSSLAAPGGEGWTLIERGTYSSAVTLGAWWKLAGASESESHQFTWTGDEPAYGWMMRFTGQNSDDPIDGFSASGELSSTPTSPAVTTTVENCLILRLGGFDDDDITVDNPGLSGHTAITMDESASSGGIVIFENFSEAMLPSNDTSITISTPGGTSEGDLLIAAVATDGGVSQQISAPSGWTLINRGSDSGDNATLGVWWKPAGASEPANYTFTWTGANNEEAYGWIMRFTSHLSGAPINASAIYSGSSSSPECPSVTTTVANTMIVRVGGFDDDDITVDSPGLTGHTAITMDRDRIGSVGICSGGAGYIQQAAIGASGTSTFSLTASEQYVTVTFAIAPAPAADIGAVSGGAGYVRQSAIGDSGTSTFALTASEQSQSLTIAIAPTPDSGGGGDEVRP